MWGWGDNHMGESEPPFSRRLGFIRLHSDNKHMKRGCPCRVHTGERVLTMILCDSALRAPELWNLGKRMLPFLTWAWAFMKKVGFWRRVY